MYSLLIKNGRIYDSSTGIDTVADIAVENGKIAAIAANIADKATETIDAKDCLVTAGWIDIHTHVYEYGTPNGMPMDIGAIPMGVTALADAGSTGVANYRELLNQMRAAKIKSKLMLNVSACGIVMPGQFPEPLDPSVWDIGLFEKAFEKYGDRIMGLKLRASKGVVKELGLLPLKKAVEAAEKVGTKVIVHVTDGAGTMSGIADCLRPGDVFCHVYHGSGNTILDADGKVSKGIWAARERGVIFDAAAGRGNFSQTVARAAIEQGFLPDSISTDVTLQNWHHSFAGALPTIMSKYLPLGLTVEQIIDRVTVGPAAQYEEEGLGTLKIGSPADITIAKVQDIEAVYPDRFGNTVTCDKVIVPKATIIDGAIQYRAVDCMLL